MTADVDCTLATTKIQLIYGPYHAAGEFSMSEWWLEKQMRWRPAERSSLCLRAGLLKGAFFNYFDKILVFLDHPSTLG